MTPPTQTELTRRQVLVAGGTFAGYAMSVDTVLAQAIKTDTDGLVAGDQTVPVGGVNVPMYEARPASGSGHPIVLVISEIWGVHEYIKDTTRRFARPATTLWRPSCSCERAAWRRSRTSRTSSR